LIPAFLFFPLNEKVYFQLVKVSNWQQPVVSTSNSNIYSKYCDTRLLIMSSIFHGYKLKTRKEARTSSFGLRTLASCQCSPAFNVVQFSE